MARKQIVTGLLKGAKALKTQTKKQVSKQGFDNSKVLPSNVKVTKIKKPATAKVSPPKKTSTINARKATGAKKVTPNKVKAPVKKAVSKPAQTRTTAPKKPLTTAQKKANDAAVKAGGRASSSPAVKKSTSKTRSKGAEALKNEAPVKVAKKKVAKKAPVKKAAKKVAKKVPTKKAAKKATKSNATKSVEKNLKKSSKPKKEVFGKVGKSYPAPPKQGPSGEAAFTAGRASGKTQGGKRAASLARAIGKQNTVGKKAKRATKKAIKKSKPYAIPAGSLGAGYLGGKAGSGGSTPKTKSPAYSGYSREEMLRARKAVYGY